MPDPVTIIDLIRNETMSAEMAATLWAVVDERRSFVGAAVPRLAGKSTATNAVLSLLPSEAPVHRLSGEMEEMAQLKERATGGYLAVGEFSQGPMLGYIWGEPVRRVFDTMTAGYSLVTTIHAPGLGETFDQICNGNGGSDADASRIGFILYILRFGEDPESYWRRVAEVHEIDEVRGGQPRGRLLHRWIEEGDRFEAVDRPTSLRTSAEEIVARAANLKALAEAGRSSPGDVARMVAEHAARRSS